MNLLSELLTYGNYFSGYISILLYTQNIFLCFFFMSGETLNFFFLTRLIEFVHFSEIKQNTSPALLLTGEICLYTLNNISITILGNLPAFLSVSLVNP